MNFVTAMLMALGLVAPKKEAPTLPPPPPASVMPADADMAVNPDFPMDGEVVGWTAGPFASYAAAVDYADYLEIEYGFYTRVVLSGGWYYVIYW